VGVYTRGSQLWRGGLGDGQLQLFAWDFCGRDVRMHWRLCLWLPCW
jgi:hypothetical protein